MLKRWYKNIRWLFNNPPTTYILGDAGRCDYCGSAAHQRKFGADDVQVGFCFSCLKKALDKVLKED